MRSSVLGDSYAPRPVGSRSRSRYGALMDALREEFPGTVAALAPLGRVSVARTGLWRAFLIGIGASFIVRAIAQLVVVVLFPLVFPATSPRPSWLSPALLWDLAGELAAGMVLVRAGGVGPLGLYVGLELLVLLAALPGRMLFCSRIGTSGVDVACDVPSMVLARWPLWLALALGALAFRALARRETGDDRLPLAAGAFSVVITAIITPTTAIYYLSGASLPSLTITGIYAVANIIAGLVAGAVLSRATFVRPLLIAVCLVGPAYALAVPALRVSLQALSKNPQPPDYYLSLWAGVLIPAGAAIAVFAGRELRREWRALF